VPRNQPQRNPNLMAGLLPSTEDFIPDIPEPEIDDTDERRKKSISKTKQWKEFVRFARDRQALYRRQTPGGILYNSMPKEDAAHYSGIGNAVMDEIETLINFIEGA
jgi:hypothetical protein